MFKNGDINRSMMSFKNKIYYNIIIWDRSTHAHTIRLGNHNSSIISNLEIFENWTDDRSVAKSAI